MKKFFLIGFLVIWLSFGLAAPTLADTLIPEFNPVCWQEKDCIEARRGLNPNAPLDVLKKGWLDKQLDCPGDGWGKCLPGGQTITTISFGGKNEFSDVGSFITQMYRYAIGVAGIIAVIVVTVSGIQWAASGGSAEVISSAKTRIGGALIGLCLVYLSYTILNTINPNLVNLRLPNVWMLKPRSIMPQFCSQASETVKNKPSFAFAADTDNQQAKLVAPTSGIKYAFTFKNQNPKDKNEMNFYCGKRFYVENGGANTCWGNYCDPIEGKSAGCIFNEDSKQYECKKGNIFGTVTYLSGRDSLAHEIFTQDWNMVPLGKISLWYVCDRGENQAELLQRVLGSEGKIVIGQKKQSFSIEITDVSRAIDDAETTCNFLTEIKHEPKFFLVGSFDEALDPTYEEHALGRGGEDLGDVDFNGFFNRFNHKIPKEYFFSKQDVLNTITLNFDAGQINDIDVNATDIFKDTARAVYYEKFNLTSLYSK